MFLSTREKEIIEMLIKYHGQYVTIYDIAQHLAVSSRTIHRELKSIESFLSTFDIELERVTKKGIQLKTTEMALNSLKHALLNENTIDLSQEEQKVIILYALIQTNTPIKQYVLAQEIGVSNQTMTKLLDELDTELDQYQLTLQKKRGEGIQLHGAESKKRELLSQLMVNNLNSTSVYSVIENHFVYQSINQSQLAMVDMDKIFQIERILMDHLGQLPYSLTESSYLTLTVHIVLSIERMLNNQYVALNDDIYNSVKDSFEHEVAKALALHLEHIYGVQFNQAEVTFITIHLRGAKRKESAEVFKDSKDESKIEKFIHSVSHFSQQSFKDFKTLSEGLKLHIIPAINRLNANIETYNPLTEMIQHKYPRLFESVHRALLQTWPDFNFPDSEIAFIVLHFGGALQNQNSAFYNVLVVCSSGIGTSRLLATRLQQTFSDIQNTTQASVGDLNDIDTTQFDAIISTVDLDIALPYITVNPLLPDADVNHVSAFLNTQHKQPKIQTYETNHSNILNPEEKLTYIRKGLEIIDSVNVDYTSVSNWTTYLTNTLLEHQIITEGQSFAELIKQHMDRQGFVLDPYPIAIPHLKSEIIKKPFILITILNEPILLNSNQNDNLSVRYLLSMFVPPDDTMAQLVSDISGKLVEHLDNIDGFMEQPEQLQALLKQSYLMQLQKLLNME
ncbi:BglG family transcription antiterminator [Staphylococcus pseudoxylosus]|uniref:PRD domain-containing protein n=1 Tax=Staphylococcus pseudoxylosus TaxID=2282419 RepID=A0AAQ0S5X6_9STAP|nr:BglG family transcription antiterminator [Staphylococcus pseudoxylosus]PTI81825.1 PTS lactose transporter subunit IIB [Staphylococcus xylosus]MBM2659543.1 BglG family transcription antiterminator [Staphylococcus pseudoxylosus]MCE5003181.1 BglG family transcription antiterminator [Staphylococcus pseudoxylosus]MDW8544774.1 BglG family transcription antiterminator [Staphylococcus pseudoxylosus]MEB5784175.1 BglG family transcription antiterminator [Staphylococcus pseudoxylosus]